MKTIIPLYRAKKIDSDEYIIGWLLQDCFGLYIIPKNNALRCENLNWESVGIDPSTLSIHFPDMLDSEGTKIFASLSEDSKGGDMLTFDKDEPSTVCKIENGQPIYKSGNVILAKKYLHLKITGIKQ